MWSGGESSGDREREDIHKLPLRQSKSEAGQMVRAAEVALQHDVKADADAILVPWMHAHRMLEPRGKQQQAPGRRSDRKPRAVPNRLLAAGHVEDQLRLARVVEYELAAGL